MRYFRAQIMKVFRMPEEFNQLGHFTLDVFLAGDVGKGNFRLFLLLRQGLEKLFQFLRPAQSAAQCT